MPNELRYWMYMTCFADSIQKLVGTPKRKKTSTHLNRNQERSLTTHCRVGYVHTSNTKRAREQHFLQDYMFAWWNSDQLAHTGQSLRCPSEGALDPCYTTVNWEDSDQTARMRRLIWVLSGRIYNLVWNLVARLKNMGRCKRKCTFKQLWTGKV